MFLTIVGAVLAVVLMLAVIEQLRSNPEYIIAAMWVAGLLLAVFGLFAHFYTNEPLWLVLGAPYLIAVFAKKEPKD